MLPDGCFHFYAGPDAAWFCVECPTNLVNWTPVCTNQVIEGSIDFVEPDAPNDHAGSIAPCRKRIRRRIKNHCQRLVDFECAAMRLILFKRCEKFHQIP